ncbi:MAG: polymerase alpha chain [Pseudomonadota bacterium]|jgi:DNA polymerase-3 subunit alpha
MQFTHLHVHSEYALSDGLLSPSDLASAAKRLGMESIALTDPSNLFGMLKFQQAAEKAGIKPIFGSQVWVKNAQQPAKLHRLILLCQNQIGLQHLMALVSRAYTEGLQDGIPQLEPDWICAQQAGLIAIANAEDGEIAEALLADNEVLAKKRLLYWQQHFGDRFYLEITRTGKAFEHRLIPLLCAFAKATDCPLVATNAVRFLSRDDFDAHEARVCIHQGQTLDDERRPRLYTEQQYLRNTEEMESLFSDIPSAIQNAIQIGRRCTVELQLGKVFLPVYPIPNQESPETFLSAMAKAGLTERFALSENIPDNYAERLQTELKVINQMGFASYFLIVADFIRWAKKEGIAVGPGRGSGAGSLVAYALSITDIDPLAYDLLFERFLNPERVSMPDFDIDFCMDGRDRVIEYVYKLYGRKAVAQIITYGTMAAKAVIRDVGRVMGFPYGFVDKIAKLIPFELGITLDKALEQEPQLKERYAQESDVTALIDLARKLEGITRNAGKHAGGVVIAPSQLTEFTPLYCDSEGAVLTQLDKNDVEYAGLVKFDFLGLRTLTIIDWALRSINADRAKRDLAPIILSKLPLDDKKTFALLCECQTTAVFQLESRGMKDLIRRLQPDTFEDIIALVALFRPGPLQSGMVDDFINRKQGRSPIEYLHPALEHALKPTYGIILYQEQVMQIAQTLAGYTLGAADLLRRAMGKKKPEEMAKQRSIFTEGAVANGVSADIATPIFDLMEKFAGYGFNKSHSAGYALITYQTAWLKAHYPAHFMAAVLSSDMAHTDKTVNFIAEARRMGLCIDSPNVNVSEYRFVVGSDQRIVYGLGAIKGIGESAINHLVGVRNEGGPFTDLFSMCQRLDLHKVTKRVIEALIKCGALDIINPNRALLCKQIDSAVQAAEQYHKRESQGQIDLFGASLCDDLLSTDQQDCAYWSEQEKLQYEKETLGLYLTGHPMVAYQSEIRSFVTSTLKQLKPDRQRLHILAGLLINLRTVQTRRGDRMAIITLDDNTAHQEMILFGDLYQNSRSILEKDALLIVEGQISEDSFSGGLKVRCHRVWNLDQAQCHFIKQVTLRVTPDNASTITEWLRQHLSLTQMDGPGITVHMHYIKEKASANITLGKQLHLRDIRSIQQLRGLCGADSVSICY